MQNRIAEWRHRRGMTTAELAESIGTSSVQITRLENGSRGLSIEWMIRLAAALGCIPAELLPREMYEPALSHAEKRIIENYRALDDENQVRWQKAFAAYCGDIEPQDLALTS